MERRAWALQMEENIRKKYPVVVGRNHGKIPYTAKEGRFDDLTKTDIGWWTNGFYGGMLWQLYHLTGQELYRREAEELEEKLNSVLMNYGAMDHDSGFRFLLTTVADYRLTGSQKSKNRGLLAAENLAGRYNPAGEYLRAWNDAGDGTNAGKAIIDCMMNLPLLYWASDVTKDPRYYNIAVKHADTAQRYFIREDGSARHIVEFDAESGRFVCEHGGQGYAQGSAWTRGQAWALYGFALSYRATGCNRYLHTAERVADYFTNQIPEDGKIPVDFRQPEECQWEDSSAAAIAASGLLLLGKVLTQDEQEEEGIAQKAAYYEQKAWMLLRFLEENRCHWDADHDELIEKCTAAFHDETHEFPIIYGDYFFMEAILRLTGKEIFLW